MCNERITGGLIAERERPGLASTMWGTLNLDGAPHQIFAGIHHPGDKSVAQPKFESKPFFSKMCVGLFLSLWSRLLPQERNCLFAMVGTSQFCTQLSFIVLFNVVVAGLIDSCETLVCLSTHGRSQVCRSTVSWLRGLTFVCVG